MVSRTALEHAGQFDYWGDYLPQPATTGNDDHSQRQTCWLNQFSALKISGPDAERFLQGQFTCNMSEITTNTVVHGACCTAKGRIVANFNISFDGDNYWLILPSTSAETLEKHLQKYKVFFKASIENCTQSHLIFGQWNDAKAGAAIHSEHHHQLTTTNNRSFIIIENDKAAEHSLSPTLISPTLISPTLNWRLDDIKDGIFYVEGEQVEQWIPQHINWHQINGISFSKGCYTGQEIIARLQYLGKAKKALYHYQGTAPTALNEAQLAQKHLLGDNGKQQADLLILRSQESAKSDNNTAITINALVVAHGENPPASLYFNESMDFSLTLQNLPYTDEKEV